jgi:hypothetical protein
MDWFKEIEEHFGFSRKYKPGTLWMARETIWGWEAQMLTKDRCLKYGDVVMVLGYYQHADLREDVLVLHGDKVIILANIDVSHVFDLNPGKKA